MMLENYQKEVANFELCKMQIYKQRLDLLQGHIESHGLTCDCDCDLKPNLETQS